MNTDKPSKEKRVYPIPERLNRELMDTILNDIRRGAPKKHAAEANGIAESHFYQAIQQGITDFKAGDTESKFAYLAESIRKIAMDEIISCKKEIASREKSHKGAEWILEHVHWREFCADAKIMELAKELELLQQQDRD